MSVEHLLSQFLASGTVSAALKERFQSPADRLAIYRFVVDREPRTFRHLLLSLFDEEIAFREALWEGTAIDQDGFYEGIYHCAFLIHCCQEPSDTMTIWKAQYLNQDIGELDGEYFIGSGLAETLSYLSSVGNQTSIEISQYIEQWSHNASLDSLASWQQGRREWIREDAERLAS